MDWRRITFLWTEKKYRYRWLLVLGIFFLWGLYNFFVYHSTYSRDAFVYAHTFDVNAEVSGAVHEIFVKDSQRVQKGEVLFTLDARPYEYALKKAESDFLIAKEKLSPAEINRAEAIFLKAQNDLNHTVIRAEAQGMITNFDLRVGDYVKQGQSLFALVDTSSWWIITRYRETVLRKIALKDPVRIYIDMYPHKTFHGTVDSIGWGINRKEASPKAAASSLPYLAPTEDWIRIAQRFPVRIRITDPDLSRYPLRVGANAKTKVQ